jgi:hypothetical protein
MGILIKWAGYIMQGARTDEGVLHNIEESGRVESSRVE